MKKIVRFLLCFGLFLLPSATLLDATVMDASFYQQAQQKYQVSQTVKMSDYDLSQAMDTLLAYLKNDQDHLELRLKVNFQEREIFNQREKDHMVDVKVLYQALHNTVIWGTIVWLLLFVIWYFKDRNWYHLLRSYNRISLAVILFVGIIVVFAATNFNAFWTMFHQLLFRNDLWLLNPNTDLLINFVPEPLFYDLVFKIVTRILIYSVLSNGIVWYLKYRLEGQVNDD